jgi:hypothetical protein
MPDTSLSALAQELLQRELSKPKPMVDPMFVSENPLVPATGQPMTPADPVLVSLLAGVGDAASTYNFLHKGIVREGNAMWRGSSSAPKIAAGTELENLAMNAGLHAARKVPLLRKLVELIQPNFAAHQALLAGNNLDLGGQHGSSDERTLTQLRNAMLGQQTPY